ncbi:MAG TPA: alpha/beta hydrolase, partial [Sphingomonadaceae bacterium]|nr:alpha/beta hydrolase [Sphingomonadaceae bacterium]
MPASRTERSWTRTPLIVSFADNPKFTETYGFAGNSGHVNLEGQLLRDPAKPSATVYVFMHPTSVLHLLPMPTALADAGLHVLCAASRYPRNDSALIFEKVAIDLGKWVAHAYELGYEKVVLVGWSGGGSLALFYQAQAEAPDITHTPAGDPVDLVAAGLRPADGVIFIAAHLSRAETLTEWLDPSVIDEADPDTRDREFDIYAADCPHQPPYDAAFVARFREAQRARNRKITAWAQAQLARLRSIDS